MKEYQKEYLKLIEERFDIIGKPRIAIYIGDEEMLLIVELW